MSTCPDRNLYSAYVDGEVPSPWKEKLEEHLASCEKCRAAESRYRAMRDAVRKASEAEPAVSDDFLESSFKKLSPRWELAAEKASAERAASTPAVTRKAATIPWAALAAMFLVVAFVPAFFAVRSAESRAPEAPPMQVAQDGAGVIPLAGLQNGESYVPVYVTIGDGQEGEGFTFINQARMFSQDKEAFSASGNGYVIIRLPEMVRFGGELPEAPLGRRGRAAGRRGGTPMPLPPSEDARGEPGYIINVRQR